MSTHHQQMISTKTGPLLVSVPNLVMKGAGFYISYNDHDTPIYGSDTTALVLGQMEKFYILNGDHRTQYAPLIESGFDACLEYFQANIDLINMRSDKPPVQNNDRDNKCDEAANPQP